jgi:hypothetical protein
MRPSLLGAAALLASLSSGAAASAQGARPVMVEYDAPAGCAPSEAFQRLLQTQIARFPEADRTWRWAVRIHREGAVYEGTVTSEASVRSTRACRCDDVTAAAALLIAGGEPEDSPPQEPLVCAPPVTAPAFAPPPVELSSPAPPPPSAPSRPEWRLGVRGEYTNHGAGDGTTVAGAMATLSLEIPGGFSKMMFEVAAGKLSSTDGDSPLSYTVLDTSTCLLDWPLGTTGLSVLGCLRVAGAAFNAAPYTYLGVQYPQSGGALWAGVGGRVRWQVPFGLFVEASLTGMYGTVSGGESTQPAWYDAALSAGFRL